MRYPVGKDYLKCIAVVLAFSFCSCQSPVGEYPISSGIKLPKLNGNLTDSLVTQLNICQLFSEKWDSILVVNPYVVPGSIKSLDIKNYTSIDSKVEMQSSSDMTCTLLFTYKGRYVGYNTLNRRSIDFVPLATSKDSQYAWISKSECNKVEIIMSFENHSLVAQFK